MKFAIIHAANYLLALLTISVAQAAESVPNSLSPDRKLQIAVQMTDDQPLYRVATPDLRFVHGSFTSDCWSLGQCLRSGVFWRQDGAYFVIQEAPSGIHQQFVVVQKTAGGDSAMQFDRNDVMKSSKLSWHHGAVRFERWLPKDRLEVTVYGDLDVSRADFECAFVLDLKHDLRVLSCHVIKPK